MNDNNCPPGLREALQEAMDDLIRNQGITSLDGPRKIEINGWPISQCMPAKPGDDFVVIGSTWRGETYRLAKSWSEGTAPPH